MTGVVPSKEFNDQLVKVVRENARQQRSSNHQQARWQRHGAQLCLAKSSGPIAKGSFANVTIWRGKLGTEADIGTTVSALNRFGDIEGAGWLLLLRIGGGWLIVMAECQ